MQKNTWHLAYFAAPSATTTNREQSNGRWAVYGISALGEADSTDSSKEPAGTAD